MKLLKFIGLLALSGLVGYGIRAQINPKHKPTEPRLSAAFQEYNHDYFHNELPPNTRIWMHDLTPQDWLGHLEFDPFNQRWTISIDVEAHPTEKQAEMTLVHEMCHEWDHVHDINEGEDGHNSAHEDCMLSVAKKGGFHDLW